MAPLGGLACQRDPYLVELETEVLTCEPSSERAGLFRVVTKDSVLFPEGGGQPADRGRINGIEVADIQRERGLCVIYMPTEIAPGTQASMKLDWSRRFDHMQQHTGQHVISAVIEQQKGWATVGWNLGEGTCFVELSTPSLDADVIQQFEESVNAEIKEPRDVIEHVSPPGIEAAAARVTLKSELNSLYAHV